MSNDDGVGGLASGAGSGARNVSRFGVGTAPDREASDVAFVPGSLGAALTQSGGPDAPSVLPTPEEMVSGLSTIEWALAQIETDPTMGQVDGDRDGDEPVRTARLRTIPSARRRLVAGGMLLLTLGGIGAYAGMDHSIASPLVAHRQGTAGTIETGSDTRPGGATPNPTQLSGPTNPSAGPAGVAGLSVGQVASSTNGPSAVPGTIPTPSKPTPTAPPSPTSTPAPTPRPTPSPTPQPTTTVDMSGTFAAAVSTCNSGGSSDPYKCHYPLQTEPVTITLTSTAGSRFCIELHHSGPAVASQCGTGSVTLTAPAVPSGPGNVITFRDATAGASAPFSATATYQIG